MLNSLRRSQLERPHQTPQRRLGDDIRGQPPSYDALYALLTNPWYAGIYGYGRRQHHHDPLTQQAHVRRRPREDWEVFIPNHPPGYITLEAFEEHQRLLADKRRHLPQAGTPRRGPSL